MTVLPLRFGTLQLRRCGDRAATCPFRQPSKDASRDVWIHCLGVDQASRANDLLLASVTRADDMMLLRQIVADGCRPVAWLSNHQVVQQVARKVARRELCLLMQERIVVGAQMTGAATVAAVAAGVTPSMLFGRSEPLDPVAAPVEAEWMDDIDQPVQVRALEQAARDGMPFCEMCEKARQANAAGASGAAL